jgi:adenine-specific DNA-methyltransferase
LDSSNFKIWQADAAPQSAEQLAEQLKLYADNVQAGRGEQDRLYELVLKSGFPLSVKIETVTASLKPAFSVADGILLICLADHLDQKTLRALFARKPQMVLCLDTAFDGNDALKTNTVLEAQTHKIMFKTV